MKREKKLLRKQLKTLNAELNSELNKHDTPEWNGQKVQTLMSEIKAVNEKLHKGFTSSNMPNRKTRREIAKKRKQEHSLEKSMRSMFPPDKTKLCCPQCGAPDKGNRLNGKPWCFKCNLPLVDKKFAQQTTIKVLKGKYPQHTTFSPINTPNEFRER